MPRDFTRNQFVEWGRIGGKIGGKKGKKTARLKCSRCGSFRKKETPCKRCGNP